MAEWKKVIVSGSSAHLSELKVGSNQQITNLQATTALTGSFTGSFSGNGAGLSGLIAASGTVTSSVQTVAHLASSTIHSGSFFNGITVVSGSSQITYLQLTGVPTGIVSASSQVLAGTTIHSGSFFNGITVVSGSAQVLNGSGVFSGSAQLPSGIVSSSAQTIGHLPTGTVSGSSQILAGLASSTIHSGSFFNGITVVSGSSQVLGGTTIHSGSFFNGITVVSGSSQISYTGLTNIPSGIVSSSALSSPSQGNISVAINGTSTTQALGLQISDSPTFTDLTLTGGDLNATTSTTFNLINANQTTVNFAGAATAINIGAATGTTTVNNNLSVKGTLYVEGSVTAISSSNLYVADQFILLASGSPNTTDGGIIIDRGSYAGQNIAYGFDSTTGRWGYQAGVTDTSTAIDPTSASGVSGSFAVYSFTQASHGATKPVTGEFAVVGSQYLDDAGNFWIYTV